MDYNFEEQFYPFQSAQESRYADPLEYLKDEGARRDGGGSGGKGRGNCQGKGRGKG